MLLSKPKALAVATTVERQGFPDCVVYKTGGGRQVRDPGDVQGLVISGGLPRGEGTSD